jgi:hypothetical protein
MNGGKLSMGRRLTALGGAALLVLVFASTVVAGTGVGGTFQLGVNNTVNAASTLLTTTFTGTSTSWATSLQVINNATTGLSRSLYVLSKSPSAPAAVIQNPVGTALWLQGPAGKPPIVVSAGMGTATNLSADRLDGIDSTGFMKGKGSFTSGRWLAAQPDASFGAQILQLPGFGAFGIACFEPSPGPGGSYGAFQWRFWNTSGGDLHLMWNSARTGTGQWLIQSTTGSYGYAQYNFTSGNQLDQLTLQAGRNTGATHRLVTITATAYYVDSTTDTCTVQAQAVMQVN